MRQGEPGILRPEQTRYLQTLLPRRDDLLREMEEAAARDDVPISVPEVGRLLEILVRSHGARRILEVGTAIGYGALSMARGGPQARLISIDNDAEALSRARGYLERGGVLDRVELLEGAALEVLPTLVGEFDLVYLDAAKVEYRRHLDLVLPKVAVGGLVVADNLLWGGWIAEPAQDEDEAAEALAAFNPYFMIHPQLVSVILPIGDGVGIGTKTAPLITEMGGPF